MPHLRQASRHAGTHFWVRKYPASCQLTMRPEELYNTIEQARALPQRSHASTVLKVLVAPCAACTQAGRKHGVCED